MNYCTKKEPRTRFFFDEVYYFFFRVVFRFLGVAFLAALRFAGFRFFGAAFFVAGFRFATFRFFGAAFLTVFRFLGAAFLTTFRFAGLRATFFLAAGRRFFAVGILAPPFLMKIYFFDMTMVHTKNFFIFYTTSMDVK